MRISQVAFLGQPANYKKIDSYLSRSAQPQEDDFIWLKEHQVTDVINFRTLYNEENIFKEKKIVESLGMKYHQIPSITKTPSEKNIYTFINLMEDITQNGGKAHIHCKAGADRTGMYAYIYESVRNIATQGERLKEWITMGHHLKRFPDLLPWTVDFVNKIKRTY